MDTTQNDTNIIQRARDVLAKWRDGTSQGPWVDHHFPSDDEAELTDASGGLILGSMMANYPSTVSGPNARLIVGTTDPDLLDALDRLLGHTAILSQMSHFEMSTYGQLCTNLAAAIIAADERMGN